MVTLIKYTNEQSSVSQQPYIGWVLFSEGTVTIFFSFYFFPLVSTPRCGSIRCSLTQLNYGWRFDRRHYPYGRAGCEKALIAGRTQYL